jgi:hypothetical protein
MNRELIYVFPDYCSTGLWRASNGHNVEPSRLGVSSGLQIALKYWHKYWELILCEATDMYAEEKQETPYWAKVATAKWVVDGYELARLLTNESFNNDPSYEFQYKE